MYRLNPMVIFKEVGGVLLGMFGLFSNDDDPESLEVVEDKTVYVETASNEVGEFTEDQVQYDHGGSDAPDKYNVLWLASPSGQLSSFHPTTLHLPVKTKTAVENLYEKSESVAYAQADVIRASVVSNPSNNPEVQVDLNVPYIELWYSDIHR